VLIADVLGMGNRVKKCVAQSEATRALFMDSSRDRTERLGPVLDSIKVARLSVTKINERRQCGKLNWSSKESRIVVEPIRAGCGQKHAVVSDEQHPLGDERLNRFVALNISARLELAEPIQHGRFVVRQWS